MKPRWQLSKNRIAQILEQHGLEVRLWDVEDGVFLGAIVDGYKPDLIQQAVKADAESRCEFCGEASCKDAECEDDY